MPDSFRHPASAHPATAQSRTSWSVELGRLRFAVTRAREVDSGFPVPAPRRSAWTFSAGALAGVGTVALLVAGANATPRGMIPLNYMVSVPVPAVAAPHVTRSIRHKGNRAVPRAGMTTATGERFDAGDEAYVARAMATGAFQEWEDGVGQRRFLTAGPARAEGGRFCRDLALLVRFAEGGSHVRSAHRCTTEPVSEQFAEQPDPDGSPDSLIEQTRK